MFSHNRENVVGYVLESALLESTRLSGVATDIAGLITDFQIFEHLDKPYLTGVVAFSDHGIVESYEIMGGEILTMLIKCSVPKIEDNRPIEKRFVIKKQVTGTKINDRTETVVFHLIEEHAFRSSLININQAYSGTPTEIIGDILQSHLNKNLQYTNNVFEGNIKAIVPNLSPLDTCIWFKNRTTSQDQLPYFLFSNLNDDKIRFMDLGTMLKQDPMNTDIPYAYTVGSNTSKEIKKYLTIYGYEYAHVHDIENLIRHGAISSTTSFIDTTMGIVNEVNFDAREGLSSLSKNLPIIQEKYNHGFDVLSDDDNIHSFKTTRSTYVASSGAYKELTGGYKSFREENNVQSYKNKVNANAIFQFMTKSPISIRVKGLDYIQGSKPDNYTVGRTIRVLFFNNMTGERAGYDPAKSGDYIIYATKHNFSRERYDVNLLLSKVANFGGDIS
jgi:hypothetical protein